MNSVWHLQVLNHYDFLNFATQWLQFSHLSTSSSTRAVCQQNTGLHKPGEENLTLLFTLFRQSIYQNAENFLPWYSLLSDPEN